MINLFTAIGRITQDLELRTTANGKSVTEANIAIKNGKEDTTFIKVTIFNQSAEFITKYAHKGDLIGTSGIIKNHNWTDKDGNKRYDYNFIANRVTILAQKKAEATTKEIPNDIPTNAKTEYEGIEISDSELPF